MKGSCNTFLTKKYGLLHTDEKIGSGNLRDCFKVTGHEDLCLKVQKKLGFFKGLQASLLHRNKNIQEYQIYLNLPAEIKKYFNPIYEAHKHFLLTGIPRNHDGSRCIPVKQHQLIGNDSFWKDVEQLYAYLDKNRLWFFDVLNGNNMFVMKKSEHVWSPVIVDFKRMGWEAFPWQFNLVLRSEKKKKLKRRYEKFIRKYKG